jgi:hypothetical protein
MIDAVALLAAAALVGIVLLPRERARASAKPQTPAPSR